MTKRQQQYKYNKQAKVGEMIICPICGEVFKKKQYSQSFCCKQCKDTYWNAKGDRHYAGYYDEYDAKHRKRMECRALYGSNIVVSIGGDLTPRQIADIEEKFQERKEEIEIYGIKELN